MEKALERREDFQDILTKVIGALSGSTVGLTTTKVAESAYGSVGVYPILLVTGMLGCLAAIGVVDFVRAGRARVWKIRDAERAGQLVKQKDQIIYS